MLMPVQVVNVSESLSYLSVGSNFSGSVSSSIFYAESCCYVKKARPKK
jgi:hypothetical protein